MPQQSLEMVVGAPLRYGAARRAIARELAAEHGGVVHRLTLAQHGIDRFGVRNEVAAGRWFTVGRHTVAVDSPELGVVAQWWRAVWESGSGARLDGTSALLAAGLTGFEPPVIDVSMPKSSRVHAVPGVRTHFPHRLAPVVGAGIRRVAAEVATIHAAQWAVSDRQAALLICLPLQQRLTTPPRVQLAWRSVLRSPRRTLLDSVIADVTDGAHSLGELDFARLARKAGLPTPTRQALRDGPGGRVYLDVSWDEVGLVVEVDGGHHALALNPIDDALRQNDRVAAGERVLRIPVIGLRLTPERFMRQVRHTYDALRAGDGSGSCGP
ncbi:endonuclease domain-containing protein [Flexivirga oryzae]|uniref:DUF559 domain-containing protein n=1 Tax=Flexivirga oryzae TaxID=1794944 RepID=A0A839MZB0_9MICO|nr:endonuclease domain-containing protein [Flexivirga oryzae]MBB2890487.1 hypothetical protein [Flexivirga oryzae]